MVCPLIVEAPTYPIARSIGRVRQVGPPAPFVEISFPSNSCTTAPARSSRRFVSGFPANCIGDLD